MAYCGWFSTNTLQRMYHEEWGTPLHDDVMQFEYISMEVMQCGLKFLGPIVIYSHLQACGIINDHDAQCSKRKYLIEHFPTVEKQRDGEKGLHQF